MTHLTPDQFVDAVEGRVQSPSAAASHLAGCEACRTELASLTEVLTTARGVDVPEPSPLFWEHFSRRVRAAVETEPAPRRAGWLVEGWRPMAVLGVAVGVLVLAVVLRPTRVSAPTVSDTLAPALVTADSTPAESNEDALNVLAVVAQDLRTDELQQIVHPSSDATGAAMDDLTQSQMAALERLIKSKTSGAE